MFSILISQCQGKTLWKWALILSVLTFKPFGLRDFRKVQDWMSPMCSGSPRNLKELAWKLSFLTNMSARLGPAKTNGEHRYFFSLADLQALILCTDTVAFFWDMIFMQFLLRLSFSSCSLGSKEVTQSGHLHLQVVTNVHLLCLKMQDADQLFPGGLAQWDCCLEMARNLLITSRLWKNLKY